MIGEQIEEEEIIEMPSDRLVKRKKKEHNVDPDEQESNEFLTSKFLPPTNNTRKNNHKIVIDFLDFSSDSVALLACFAEAERPCFFPGAFFFELGAFSTILTCFASLDFGCCATGGGLS